jgi:hypothetical protein
MVGTTNYSQDDIETLFRIDFGVANNVSEDLASRFLISGYIEETVPTLATVKVRRAGLPDMYAGLTLHGRTFLAAIRDGLETRWTEWKPSLQNN